MAENRRKMKICGVNLKFRKMLTKKLILYIINLSASEVLIFSYADIFGKT
ncbi:hypothetical protein DealDRAFT_1960 [Dethiobacter alkaliphilus AHT 1]|uniref:Uncharacterized protein n=1 Tax=Dethiobacter alkaliphilus AHT 1 TaxID=555088 RepID=C0GHK1_DETAL|nr:hypothetical protein DealDRAFT_1960 [Dethiobacter alkaliphilus AHT 1]